MRATRWQEADAAPGVVMAELFRDERGIVRIERWSSGARVLARPVGGLEILCLEGGFLEGGEKFSKHFWLRLPVGAELYTVAAPEGCRLFVKEGHLRYVTP